MPGFALPRHFTLTDDLPIATSPLPPELGLDFEVKFHQRNKETLLAPPELKELHPLGKAPLLQDGDRILAETGAIIEYIVYHLANGKLGAPASNVDLHQRLIYWLHYAEGTLMSQIILAFYFTLAGSKSPFLIRPIVKLVTTAIQKQAIDPNIKANLDFMEAELTKNAWFLGPEFSAADVILSFPLEALDAKFGGFSETEYPKLKAWLTAIHSRPAYKAAVEKGGGPSQNNLDFFKKA